MARRDKPTSCRPLKLTAAQQIEVRAWYYSARTVAEKASQLGVCEKTLYRYINRMHKPRKPTVGEVESELMSVPRDVSRQLGDKCTQPSQ